MVGNAFRIAYHLLYDSSFNSVKLLFFRTMQKSKR